MSDGAETDVTVVIPFGGDDDLLAAQLAAVDASATRAARLEGLTAEIVVSANLAPVGVSRIVPGDLRTPTRVVDSSDRRGAPHARNVGAKLARGRLLLFCDSDDVVDPDWVTVMARMLNEHDVVAGGHDLHALNPQAGATRRNASSGPSRPYRWLPCGPSSNLAISRKLFVDIGGFDETFKTSEDLDLCWRAQYAGGVFGWVEEPLVQYRWRDDLRAHMRQTYRWGRDSGDIVRKHRPYGLKPSLGAGVRDLAGAVVRVGVFVLVPSRRWNAAGSVARTWGRLVATARERVWTLGG
jgi:cellulose synthase/poly-beta-1,6-N-acetylglucosamine synthase-like glycosyltransferase